MQMRDLLGCPLYGHIRITALLLIGAHFEEAGSGPTPAGRSPGRLGGFAVRAAVALLIGYVWF